MMNAGLVAIIVTAVLVIPLLLYGLYSEGKRIQSEEN